ncbi:MAG: PqqD family protein [Gemmatimonadota bacterium]
MTLRYRAHPELRLTALEGEGVVLHLGSRRYFSVNETGLAILEAIKPSATIAELVTMLTGRFEVTTEQAEQSVRAFLDRCLTSKLVEEVAG